MSARSWDVGGAPEPADRPAVVDDDGVTWRWMAQYEEDYFAWTRMHVTRHTRLDGGPGLVSGYSTAIDWADLLDLYGLLREASVEEAGYLTVEFQTAVTT